MKAHIREMDILKTVGCFLVIVGHSFPAMADYPLLFKPLYIYIYSFHLPLFFFLSGFLFYSSGGVRSNYINFIGKKFTRLMWPYLFLSVIGFFLKLLVTQYTVRHVDLSLNSFIDNLVFPWHNAMQHLWFLQTLFIIFTISPAFSYTLEKKQVLLVSGILIMLNIFNPADNISIFNIEGVVGYAVYFWLGCLASRYIVKHTVFVVKPKYHIIASIIALGVLYSFFFHTSYGHFLIASLNIWLWLCLAILYRNYNMDWLDAIWDYGGKYYFQMYLLSWPAQEIIGLFLIKACGFGFLIVFILRLLVGILVPMAICHLLAGKPNFKYKSAIGL
ncbi:Acyltransferase family protein [Sporomusa ovata DSM 2662]|uniref:Membrane protein n=1 Tax=Sporomusa ovata TaxID=2378 RepID=A0A0U1KSY4_9FIRM|nr:acyltransferase [Sporomusa ovata]EQB26437.1 fucose 4-O-acetylase [Sporomusa ovata DSM 2662]CQR70521.1 membrane protein [Sporomusa ovata]